MPRPARLAAEYGTLVGIPIVVILAVLHLAADAEAPPHIAGRWGITAMSRGDVPGECLAHAAAEGSLVLRINQSGRYLSARLRGWSGTEASAVLNAGKVEVEWDAAADVPCVRALRLTARVTERDGERLLVGHLAIPGCRDCGTTQIVARRLPPPDVAGR